MISDEIKSLFAVRAIVPDDDVRFLGKAETFFDFLPNNSDLTEEFLYAHQPTANSRINVYATNPIPIGSLDDNEYIIEKFRVLEGPVIVVARKGYAGRMFLIRDKKLIVHEDAYAVVPKKEYLANINLSWFAMHYDFEFQANRTSLWGIGDFPREKFKSMIVKIPELTIQSRLEKLYIRRNSIIAKLNQYRNKKEHEISLILE